MNSSYDSASPSGVVEAISLPSKVDFMSIEAIAILITGAGIVVTCGIETWLVTRQIRSSEHMNREQLEVQNKALESQFNFHKNEARRARILSNHRESMEIIREVSEKKQRLSPDGQEPDFYTLIENTSLAFIIDDLCRDLEDDKSIRRSFLKMTDDDHQGLSPLEAETLIAELMWDIRQATEVALKELEKSL